MALVLSMIVLTILSVLIIALASEISMDLEISRNLRLRTQAFNAAEALLSVSEEMIAYAMDTRDADTSSNGTASYSVTLGSEIYTVGVVTNTGNSLYLNGGNLTMSLAGQAIGNATIVPIGSRANEGGSIIIAAGYEGVGKGAGSSAGTAFYFQIDAQGVNSLTSASGSPSSIQRLSEIYRYVHGGGS